MTLTEAEFVRMVDHTLLKAEATEADVVSTADDGRRLGTASVCVNGSWISTVASVLAGTDTVPCAVVGFPLGATVGKAKAVEAATKAFNIQGLASADFVLAENRAYLLEVNPRPGATLDIFGGAAKPLLAFHLAAVIDGKLPRKPPAFEGAAASAILYAPKVVVVPRTMIWPDWAADCPRSGEQIDKHRPICTVLARAGTRGHARPLVETRKASLLAKIQDLSKGDYRERQEHSEHRGTTKRQRAGRPAPPHPHR
ncbi:MAG: hypothetical protein ACERIE_02940 [Methyloceanibacter sp.]